MLKEAEQVTSSANNGAIAASAEDKDSSDANE